MKPMVSDSGGITKRREGSLECIYIRLPTALS